MRLDKFVLAGCTVMLTCMTPTGRDTGAKIVGDRTIPITVEDVEAIVGRD